MKLSIFDAKEHVDTDPVRDLMRDALPQPDDEMLDRLLARYADDDQLQLFGALDADDNLQGMIGLRLEDDGSAMILHLRVQDDARRMGVGTALVRRVKSHLSLVRISGRATERVLPFFTALGFTNWVVGEKPPGTKWYGVRLEE